MRWRAELPYLLPVVAVLHPLLYWRGYASWFQQDDFAWLGLLDLARAGVPLSELLFKPMAQGTVRVFSERGFFLLFRWLFDLNGAPYHAAVFLTQTLNLALLYWLVLRLTGGVRAAAVLAAALWCSNSALAWPLAWVSAYNQVLIAACFLGGLAAFIRYADSRRGIWLAAVWAIYLPAFGVLELNVVFPALLLAYSWLWARHTMRAAAPMFIPAVAFAALHVLAIPKPDSGTYAVQAGPHLPATLARYWAMAIWPAETSKFIGSISPGVVWIPALAVAGLVGWRAVAARDRVAAFGLAWFFAALSVYLALPHHVSDYYLAVPSIGLSIALASALLAIPRAAAAAVLLALLPVSWYGIHRITQRAYERSTSWEAVMDGVGAIAERNAGRQIYLEGIGQDLFVQGFTDSPFRLLAAKPEVRLTPHEADQIDVTGWLPSIAPFTAPAEAVLHAIDHGAAVVYRFEGDRFRHITASYRTRLATSKLSEAAPSRVETGNAMYEYLLGPGWFAAQDGYRWMGKSARLTLGGAAAGGKLHVRGFCAPAQLAAGPLHLAVTPDGAAAPARFAIESCAGSFDFAVAVPDAVAGEPRFGVALEVDRAGPLPPDTRALGLAIETLSIEAARPGK